MNKGIFYNLPDKYTKSVVFASKVRPIVSEEKDKYLALASIDNLKKFIPNIDINKNVDLVPFALDACVANRINANGHGVLTQEALSIADNFIYKPVDIEHDRSKLVGVILTASFSEFGTSKPLTREEVADRKSPFNVTLGGVIWRIVSGNLKEILEECSDPDSDEHAAVSGSWEVAFSEYKLILLPKNKKNFEDGEVIDKQEDIAAIEKELGEIAYDTVNKEGKRVGVIFGEDVLPVGLGLTENPAADVEGVAVPENKKNEDKKENSASDIKNQENNIELSNFNSQLQKLDVKKDSKVMILKNIKDITDEVLKEAKASDIHSLLEDRIKQINDDYQSKLAEENKKTADASKALTDLKSEFDVMKTNLEAITKNYNDLVSAAKAQEEENKFSTRMASFDEQYALEANDRDVIASFIKDVKDDIYEAVATKIKTLLKGKEKKTEAVATETKTAVASTEKKEEKVETGLVEQAVETGKKVGAVAATTTVTESLSDKMKKNFGTEGWSVKNKRF